MNMNFYRKLPIPKDLKEQFPADERIKKIKAERDPEIARIFEGKSDRFLLIIGPCSADKKDTVLDYVSRLAKVQEKVKDKIYIVPRLYTNKPRTIGVGYKGMLHQPTPDGQEDMLGGIIAIRKMNVRVIEETGMTGAEEILYPEVFRYLSDLLSYAAVGARSSEDQLHRMIGPMLGCAMDLTVQQHDPLSTKSQPVLRSVRAVLDNFDYKPDRAFED